MTTAKVKHHRMLIGGNEIDSQQHLTIVDPGDESVVATVAHGDASHIDAGSSPCLAVRLCCRSPRAHSRHARSTE